MGDTDLFTDLQILALTALGESEDLGEIGMQQTINIIMNRVAANIEWMGGSNARQVCLQKNQFDCWWPQSDNEDRSRILEIANQNPLYGPYIVALGLAESALAGNLSDITSGCVSYVDGNAKACVHPGSEPILIIGERKFYDLSAVQ
jgi:hypothetical protein